MKERRQDKIEALTGVRAIAEIVQRFLKVALPTRLVDGHGWIAHVLLAVGYFAVIIVSAMLLYHLVEKPAREILRRVYQARVAGRVQKQQIAP